MFDLTGSVTEVYLLYYVIVRVYFGHVLLSLHRNVNTDKKYGVAKVVNVNKKINCFLLTIIYLFI